MPASTLNLLPSFLSFLSTITYERQGKPAQARAAYERFLQIWKDADPDIPEVVAAKARVAN